MVCVLTEIRIRDPLNTGLNYLVDINLRYEIWLIEKYEICTESLILEKKNQITWRPRKLHTWGPPLDKNNKPVTGT